MRPLGPVSSLFDALTFVIMLYVPDAELLRTGWFLDSLATEVLVIFVIRTRHSPWRSRPNPWLAIISIIVGIVAVLLPLTPIAGYLGFVASPRYSSPCSSFCRFVISAQRNGPNGASTNITICIDHTEPARGRMS